MTRITLVAALAIISLAGCTSIDQQARDACPRISPGKISTQCYNAQLARLQVQQQIDENNAAILLMGGTAFMNGWNAGRDQPLPMVNYGNRLTMCSSAGGMVTCY